MRSLIARPLLACLAATVLTALAVSFAPAADDKPAADEKPTAKPANKDTPPFLRPKEAVVSVSVAPQSAKPGDSVTYSVAVKLAKGWHIYKYSPEDPPDGPKSTKFDFFDPAGLELSGDWTASKPTIKKVERVFNNLTVESYEDDVTWSHKLAVPAGAAPGKKVLRCQFQFQVCNESSCKQPVRITLPDVELTVAGGGISAAAQPDPQVAEKREAVAPAAVTEAAETKREAVAPAAVAKRAETKSESVPPVAFTSPLQPTIKAPAVASAAPSASTEPDGLSDAERKAEQGIIPFLIFSAFGGLLALVMPCVWPMVPITVNFFVKQGRASNGGGTTRLAIAYCLAIIGIFTAVGVLCSFFFSAASLQWLANNPWLNVAVATLFIVFGLSLLGLFEIRLPNFVLNASARGESRGGMVGVMFMALTLTITSFTCTFPVVGGLIVMAAGGKFFYPIIGLATFAAVLALPFFLLALAPGLINKMPKSGDWMNSVKIVGGLVELGAAFKYINTAEIGFGAIPREAWFDARVVLSIWVILAAVCGVYLLGLFRTDHDHEAVKVGPGRILFGSLFLVLALFLAPALFGTPPQSRIWYELVGLFPPDVGELGSSSSSSGAKEHGVDATSPDPEVAEREQKSFHGVVWGFSYDAAVQKAKSENRPVLIDFTGVNCANCRKMEQYVLPRPEVMKLLGQFETVQLFTDFVPLPPITKEQREELAWKNGKLLLDLTNDTSNPSYVALAPNGRVLARLGGANPPSVFVNFLEKALQGHKSAVNVARHADAR